MGLPEVIQHFHDTVSSAQCRGAITRDQVCLTMEEQHIWSPQLAMTLREVQPGQTLIHGRFGPQPHLWTFIVALYAVCAFSGIAALMLAWSQMLVGSSPTGFAILAVAGLFALAGYLSSAVGQRLGAQQMHELHELLHRSLEGHLVELRNPEEDLF